MITLHMTTYRRHSSGLLARAVESVLSQDFRDFEFVICDDASSDCTAEYLDEMARIDPRIRVIRNTRNVNSVAISLGRCLQASDAARPWVSWMFDDCILLPGALSRLVGVTNQRPTARMVYGVTEVLQQSGDILRVGGEAESYVKARIAASPLLIPNGGILVHRDVFKNVGWYDTSIVLRRSCDWDLFRRIIQRGIDFVAVPEITMREYGELQMDSLRNTFTTTFDLMVRFVVARDLSGARLDLMNVFTRPIDWIPPGTWSPEDINLMRYMFLEYFLSVGNVIRACRWARLLAEHLRDSKSLMRENLLRYASSPLAGDQSLLATGAFAGLILGAWREQGGLA
jgi:glycosyltransferase involved in cell wall biosynthesis